MTDTEELHSSLNGGYAGLFGEVVTGDCYRINELKFVPDIIFDLGANVGVFTRFAAAKFPAARIISVEPDEDNCKVFRNFTPHKNVTLIQKAIGSGKIWRCDGAINGAHESYLSSGLGFPFSEGVKIEGINLTNIESISIADLLEKYATPNDKIMVKMDIEAAENIVWGDVRSMELLKTVDYLAMEYHQGALSGVLNDEVRIKTFESLASFIPTHLCQLSHPMFYALKRKYGNTI